MTRFLLSALLITTFAACGDDDSPSDAGSDVSNDAGSPDSGEVDSGSPMDSGTTRDAGDDAGAADSGEQDAGGVTGCRSIDVLFVLDSAGSLIAERTMLSDPLWFMTWLGELEAINGGVDVRVGVTDDDDGGFFVPVGWSGANPWFDAAELGASATANAFTGAIDAINASANTAIGCTHVLTSATDLLDQDPSGFVRPDSLLVIVLVTDRDDYGAYDQVSGNSCALGCSTVPNPVATLHSRLLSQIGGDAARLSAIIVAGDPNVNGGISLCDQPGSCCAGSDCRAFHATRLFELEALLGVRASASNLCDVNASSAIQGATALMVEPACEAL